MKCSPVVVAACIGVASLVSAAPAPRGHGGRPNLAGGSSLYTDPSRKAVSGGKSLRGADPASLPPSYSSDYLTRRGVTSSEPSADPSTDYQFNADYSNKEGDDMLYRRFGSELEGNSFNDPSYDDQSAQGATGRPRPGKLERASSLLSSAGKLQASISGLRKNSFSDNLGKAANAVNGFNGKPGGVPSAYADEAASFGGEPGQMVRRGFAMDDFEESDAQ